jgi:hypothetical protein
LIISHYPVVTVALDAYLTLGSRPYIQQAEANLETGETGEWRVIWNGTGGMVYLRSNPWTQEEDPCLIATNL